MVIIIFDVRQNRKGVTKRAVCDTVSSLFTEGTECTRTQASNRVAAKRVKRGVPLPFRAFRFRAWSFSISGPILRVFK